MQLSKLLAIGKMGSLAPRHAPWKKARIYPAVFSNEKTEDANGPKLTRDHSTDRLHNGVVDGSYFQFREGKGTKMSLGKMRRRASISRKIHARRKSLGSTSKSARSSNSTSSSNGIDSVSQATSDSERDLELQTIPSDFLEMGHKEQLRRGAAVCKISSDRISDMSTHMYPQRHQESSYMSSLDSDEEQGTPKDSGRISRSKAKQDSSGGEPQPDGESDMDRDSETEMETEQETEAEKESDSDRESEIEKQSESERETETPQETNSETEGETGASEETKADMSEEEDETFEENKQEVSEEEDEEKDKDSSKEESEEDSDSASSTDFVSAGVKRSLYSKRGESSRSQSKSSSFELSLDGAKLSPISEDEEEHVSDKTRSRPFSDKCQVSTDGTGEPRSLKESAEEDGS
ncbi:uncharacterized protein LOC143510838 [Brachyhypopomus gauderio]|uniref:uncharacterized protein LOC143510838 n=1 Tax=Brachyhypopomus gauderio TaxID=698409 RepID=UPI004041B32B